MTNSFSKKRLSVLLFAVLTAFSLVASACSSSGDGETTGDDPGGDSDNNEGDDDEASDEEIRVAIVSNPQMEDIVELTPELFTEETGITVNYTTLSENELRQLTTREITSGDEYDVMMLGVYEAPQFGKEGLLVDLTEMAADDEAYDVDDIFQPVIDGLSYEDKLYASPFYAESSFLTYRKDLFEEAGLEMPERPTWEQVADFARQLKTDDVAGICTRGKAGWGEVGATFGTVLNTFGGTYWSANEDGTIGESQVDQPEFKEALDFYVDLAQDAGQDGIAEQSFGDCADLYQAGGAAMWYDATSAASVLEAEDSPVKGLNGFAFAPVKETDASGWLWAWSLTIPKSTQKVDLAWRFISWATGPEYIQKAGEMVDGGWANIPPGTRQSTYEIQEYLDVAPFAEITVEAMNEAPVDNPGTTPRPGIPGVQFVGVPEFAEVGDGCTQQFSAAIAGNVSTEDAIADCHTIATQAAGG